MRLDHGGVRVPRENGEAVFAVDDLVDAAEVDQILAAHGEEVLRLFRVAAPLEEAARREDDPPLAQALGEGRLLRRRLRAGVDKHLMTSGRMFGYV